MKQKKIRKPLTAEVIEDWVVGGICTAMGTVVVIVFIAGLTAEF